MRTTSAKALAGIFILLTLTPACEPKRRTSFLTDEDKHDDFIRSLELRGDPEAAGRRARSIAILKAQGIPFSSKLLPIDPERASVRRSSEEVARRAVALAIVFVKGAHGEKDELDMLVRSYRAAELLSPREKAFIENPVPEDRDMTNFSWRIESLNVLLWAIGYVDKLEWPGTPVEADLIAEIFAKYEPDEFIAKAKLRPQSELLDAADLVLRYDWVAHRQKNEKIKLSELVNYDVVIERHHALNWLVGHLNEAWDDISLDL